MLGSLEPIPGLLEPTPRSLKEDVRDQLFSQDFEMPNLPQVATQAFAMAQNERSTSASLAKLICTDQSLATNLLRNWALFPDEAFRTRLIEHHRAMSALVKLFGHKDSNVAGTAIAALRHLCSNPAGREVTHLVRRILRRVLCAVGAGSEYWPTRPPHRRRTARLSQGQRGRSTAVCCWKCSAA